MVCQYTCIGKYKIWTTSERVFATAFVLVNHKGQTRWHVMSCTYLQTRNPDIQPACLGQYMCTGKAHVPAGRAYQGWNSARIALISDVIYFGIDQIPAICAAQGKITLESAKCQEFAVS